MPIAVSVCVWIHKSKQKVQVKVSSVFSSVNNGYIRANQSTAKDTVTFQTNKQAKKAQKRQQKFSVLYKHQTFEPDSFVCA